MQEKNSQLIIDLNIAEKILEKIPLQRRRTREDLVQRIEVDQLLSEKFGKVFLLTLEKGNSYSTLEKQNRAREDCIKFRALAEVCLYGTDVEWSEWSEKIENKEVVFSSWVQKPAYFYLSQLAEEREQRRLQESTDKQQNDIKRMAELSERTNLETQEEVDRLYEYLCTMDHPYFQSWVGRSFVEQLQKRTSKYQKNQRQRKILHFCSIACFVGFLALLGNWLYHQQIREREQWKNEVWDEIREGEEEPDTSDAETVQDSEMEEGGLDGSNEEELANETEEGQQDETTEIEKEQKKILKQYRKLHKKNPDMIGWLQVPGIELSLPVMQHLEDDSFYLDHNFEGESVRSGALFVDSKTSIASHGKNIVVYGHNMSSGDIFGNLNYYKEQAFWEQHPQFQFDTIYEEGTYEIIAVLKTHVLRQNEEGFRYYEFYDYNTQGEFQAFSDFVKENAIYDTGLQPNYGDSFVLLSTCEYSEEEGRLVIVGRK